MMIIYFEKLVILLLVVKVQSQCQFLSFTPLINPSDPQEIKEQNLEQEVVQGQKNVGFGLWVKYQPFIEMKDLTDRTSQIVTTTNGQMIVQGGQFIYSMEQSINKFKMVVVSIKIDSNTQTIQHNIFYSFKSSLNTLSFTFDSEIYEGLWVMFYAYYDQNLGKTTFGYYNALENIPSQTVNDVPPFVVNIRHNIGGFLQYPNQNGAIVVLNQFTGFMSTTFTTNEENIFSNLASCENFIEYDTCYDGQYSVSDKNQVMNGQDFIRVSTYSIRNPIYVLKGWLILEQLNQAELKTVIFRITINKDYSDDMYIGDREVLLQYFQSSLPYGNGFEISTYSYVFPQKGRYKTEQDQKISNFGDEFSELFIKWHYFQYELGTLNNDGRPMLSLYFPTIQQLQQYQWSQPVKHFTGVVYYVSFGGDDYSRSFMKGHVSDILLQTLCQQDQALLIPSCHYTCLTCDGPTQYNCLSCPENSFRQHQETEKTCFCQQRFVDQDGQQECKSILQAFPHIIKNEVELKCSKPGYSNCANQNIECSFGYFQIEQNCIQCPNYFDVFTRTKLTCFDCIIEPKKFAQTLKCTQDAETYHSEVEYTYSVTKRNTNDVSYFEIFNDRNENYSIKLCQGCIEKYKCKYGYFYERNQCQQCLEGCKTCITNFRCNECFPGFYSDFDKLCHKCTNCKTCLLNNGKEWCDSCYGTQELLFGKCVSCGVNCQSCNSDGHCNYCNGSPSIQYISFDGKNCGECNIENCMYCFEYMINGGVYISNLDLQFNIISFDARQVFLGCALCKQNYFFNQNTQKCQLKPANDDCDFALILTDSTQKCIISSNNIDAVQNIDCPTLLQCKQCIKNYIESDTFCILCEDGYYSGVLTGQCQQCIHTCKTCIQQNKKYRDFWKWQIKAFYKFFLNSNNDHAFENYASTNAEADLELLCTSCQLGYVLYQNQCIKDCDENCKVCEIINGKSTCVQCYETSAGFLKSLNAQGTCLSCPSNCLACLDRTLEEIYDINPYFRLTNSNAQFTRKCYEKSNKINLSENYFHDYLTQIISICTQNLQCYNKILIKQNIYCDTDDYFNKQFESNDEIFGSRNIQINNFFDDNYLIQFEPSSLYQYLNEISVRYVEYQFTFIQGNLPNCKFKDQFKIYSTLQQNVFAIQQVDLILIGSTNPTQLQIPMEFQISNFTIVTFQNIMLNFAQSQDSLNTYSILSLFNVKLNLSLKLINCGFITQNETDRNYSFTINSNIPYSLYIQNLIISNLYIYHSDIFTFTAQSKTIQNSIELQNVIIRNSYFFNSTFIKYLTQLNHLSSHSKINQIQIKDTKFIQSDFIFSSSLLNYTMGSIDINTITIENTLFQQNSNFLVLSCADQSLISNLILNNSILSLGSSFYSSNIINLNNIIINNTRIMNSSLITNKVDYTKSNYALLQSKNVFLRSCQILNVQYEIQQQILVIIKYDEISSLKFSLTEFMLQNCQIVSKTQNQQISYENSMIYIECQICLLENIKIVRGYGLPEITIINSEKLEIRNLVISQNQQFLPKALHSSIECVKQFAILNMHFFIYIGQYKNVLIDQLVVQNCLSFNSPFIIFQGYDIMQKLLTETIVIQNINFIENILIISDTNQHTSLISIESEQKSNITLSIAHFAYNHLNEYFQDSTRVSATTIFISLQQGTVLIDECTFFQNIVTNSSDSIIYIKSYTFLLQNSYFQNNGLINFSKMCKHILFSQSQDQNKIDYSAIFQIKSNGGNGLFIIQTLNINNITINTSHSYNGGGFSIATQGVSVIEITNSYFSNTISSLDDSVYALGGCLFIDASSSQLTFKLHNTIIDTSYSRHDGGAIYIIPSLSYNWIEIYNLIVRECFSLQNTFFSYTLSKIETIQSNIVFKNIQFQTTEDGFQKYFSLIKDLSEDDTSNIANSNPMIFVQYGNFSIFNCSFLSTFIQFLIKIDQAENIIFSNVKVINSTVLQSPIFKLNLRTQFSGQLQISNLQLTNVIQRTKNYADSCTQLNSTIHSELQCPTYFSQVALNLDEIDDTKQKAMQLNCNQLLIYSNKKFNYSLIEIDNLNLTHQLKVERMELANIVCETCQFGIFRILEIYQQDKEIMKLSQVTIKNCRCGNTGCLSIIKSFNEFIFKKNLLDQTRVLQQHNYDNLRFKLNQQINIVGSSFLNNTAFYGGSIFIVELGTLIKKCIFKNNSAQIGGAIYYYSSESQIFLLESEILQNTAKVAGGVFLNQQSLQLTKELDIQLSNNNSTMYGQDVLENPRSLTLSIDGGQTLLEKSLFTVTDNSIIEQIIIKPYKVLGYSQKMRYLTLPSGRIIGTYKYFDQYTSTIIPYNLTLRIVALDKFNKQNKGLSKSNCTINPFVFNISSQSEEPNFNYSLSFYNVTFNETSGDYNLDDLVIYFKPNLTNQLVLRLSIQCNSIIIPLYNEEPPFQIINNITNYRLLVDIKTFPCQLGEYANLTTGGCTLCDTVQNQYQVQWSAQSCSYKDDLKMKSIESSMIELRSGYWRAYYYSQTIEYCYHLIQNCEGGWKPGDQSCIQGHIGALCEQCDLYNIMGQGSFSISSKYSCGSCDQIAFNIITIVLISLWTLISTLMSVSSTVEMIDEFVIGLRLKAFGVTVAIKEASTAILIKLFTNYLQIVSTISTFQLQVPSGLASVVNSVGNPIESMAYSLDCFLVSITEIEIIYFRIIWGLIMAIIYITIFFSLGGVAIIIKKTKIDFSYISTSLIYLFIYLQPNIIGGLISLLSYRNISDEYWIQGNVAYRYDTISHAKWVVGFCFPLLIIFCCILPFFLWFGVHKNKNALDMTKVRRTWGYLYNEYKLNAYYWETIKILQKEIIIIVLAYYDDHIPIKASLVFLVLFGYSYMTISNKPYMTGQLNHLDTHSIVVCAVSIILASSIYTAQQQNLQEIVWPFYIIIGVLNGLYIFKMLLQILFAYFKKLNDKIDIIKEFICKKFPNFTNQHPFMKQIFESRKIQQIRVKGRYGKIREYLLPQARKILDFKKLNNFELPGMIDIQEKVKEIQEYDYGDIQSLNSPKQSEIVTERQNLKTLMKYPNNNLNERSSVFSFPRPAGVRIHPESQLEVESARQSADHQII